MDADSERVYAAFLLGLLARLEGRFDVCSNRETGLGRADVLILPKRAGEPGVVIEVKRVLPSRDMEETLDEAVAQIRARNYAAELHARGASPQWLFALAFDGKRVGVRLA